MGAIGYLYKRTLINRTKMALKKPVTYLYLALLLFYFLAVPASLKVVTQAAADHGEEVQQDLHQQGLQMGVYQHPLRADWGGKED